MSRFQRASAPWIILIMLALARFCPAAESGFRVIDLRPYCNFALTNSTIGTGSLNGANHLGSLPVGIATYASVPFQVAGIIQLTGSQAILAKRDFPEAVPGIKIGAQCKNFHILHAVGWTEVEDVVVAQFILHYADGEKRNIPIIYGKHVYDWWENEDAPTDKHTVVAWTGVNPISKMFGTSLRLYRTTFANPRSGAVIEKLDFISTKKQSAPFLLGLTVD